MSGDFEEVLRNIDVFCKVLAKKLVESLKEEEIKGENPLEPMERLIKKKYVIEERFEKSPTAKHFIPLPHIEEPLIDIFEDENYVKVLMQCRCRDQRVTVNKFDDSLQICLENTCWKLNLPLHELQVENIIMKCNNNKALEVEIPKLKTTVDYRS
ncbi:hypothetical protein KEJ32_03175 [Candidatus Bathyarchaeota archaeon]|nr:hypothetical protein [Candidatus Bathyarchaeota archaeon]MBS7636017.1 hypothetical protein [Candidatus Bathyarchaeota archaeon]